MTKNKKIKIDITTEDQIFGSSRYAVSVNVTNISNKDIYQLEVNPSYIIGKQLYNSNEIEEAELSELEDKKNKIITEMEKQIESAYERNKLKSLSVIELLFLSVTRVMDIYAGMFSFLSGKKTIKNTPVWANEALKIDEWEDVERIEKDVMKNINEDSFLMKAFLINKDKLRRILDKINQQSEIENSSELNKGFTLTAGDTLSFPFNFKAPHLLKSKAGEVQFKISYKDPDNERVIHSSIIEKIKIYPSSFAVPTGSMIGAASGYLIRLSLISSTSIQEVNWSSLLGSVLLGLLVALLTARKSNVTKAITVEDFVGGFMIGALTGIFSETILEKLKLIIK